MPTYKTNNSDIGLSELMKGGATSDQGTDVPNLPKPKGKTPKLPKNDKLASATLSKREVKDMTKKLPKSLSEIDSRKKQSIIMKIQKYLSSARFKDFLCSQLKINYTNSQLQSKNIEQLEDILNKIRVHLDSKNLDTFYNQLATSGAVMFEKSISSFYDVEGFAVNLTANPQFYDIYDRYKIEAELPSVPPSVQLFWLISQTAVLTHEKNKLRRLSKKKLHGDVEDTKPSQNIETDKNTGQDIEPEIKQKEVVSYGSSL